MQRKKKGFTLIELLIVVVIVGILALAAIPLITSNTRDARRAEGEQLLGSARDAVRVEFSKNGTAPTKVSDAQPLTAFTGKYFSILDPIAAKTVNGGAGGSIKTNTPSATDGTGTMDFQWASGFSTITWNPV